MLKYSLAHDIELCYEGLMTAIHDNHFLDIKNYSEKLQRLLDGAIKNAEMKNQFQKP